LKTTFDRKTKKGKMMEILTLDSAHKIITAALAKANAEFQRPICVSICDASGFIVAFARMEGAPLRSIEISQNKAFTAVRMGVSTDKFRARLQQDHLEASYFGERMTPLPGGNLLTDPKGKILGAIGVSGLALGEDQSITQALAELANTGAF
jgi:glc operon protein GlcG